MREAGGTKKRQDMPEQENEKRLNKLLSELGFAPGGKRIEGLRQAKFL